MIQRTYHYLCRARWLYVLALLAACGYVLRAWPAIHNGDVSEYTVTTVAIANHGTPDVRLADLEEAERRLPWMKDGFAEIDSDLRHQPGMVHLPFAKGRGDAVYSIHYFAFSALAAVPFKLLPLVRLDAFKCYLALNLFFVLMLGLTLRRVLDDNLKAGAALALFLTCGLWSYLCWSSPEVMSAAALLTALLLYCSGAPLRAGVLAAVGAMQNPSIILAFGFLPLLRLALHWQPGRGWRAHLGAAIPDWRHFAALLLGGLLALTAPLWNWIQFGTFSIIAQQFTRADLFTLARLHSLFFDLSQGMILGVPALLVLLLCWVRRSDNGWRILLAGAALTLAMALPALTVINWNSGAQGVMRYAVWGAMPLLAIMVWMLGQRRRWMLALAPVLAVQFYVTHKLQLFRYVEFSPLAVRVMVHAPHWYNPDPELFAERVKHSDSYVDPREPQTFYYKGRPIKTLYHPETPEGVRALCGEGRTPSADNDMHDIDHGWRYINGPVKCQALPASAPVVATGG